MNTTDKEQCEICKKDIDRKVVIRKCLHSFCYNCVARIARFTYDCPKCTGTYSLIAERISKKRQVESPRPPEKEEDGECCICLGEKENRAVIDACFHSFCFKCICEWAKNITQCPLCRSDFTEIYHNIEDDNNFQTFRLKRTDKRDNNLNGAVNFNELFSAASFQAQQNIPITSESTSRMISRLRQLFRRNRRRRVQSPVSISSDEEPSFNSGQFRNRAIVHEDDIQPSTSSSQRNIEANSSSDPPLRSRGLIRSQAFLAPREERTRLRRNDYSPSVEEETSCPYSIPVRVPRRNVRTYEVAHVHNEAELTSNFTRIRSARVPRPGSQASSAVIVRENLANISEARPEVANRDVAHSSQNQAGAMNAELPGTISNRRNLNARSESLDDILESVSNLQLSQTWTSGDDSELQEISQVRPKRNGWCLNCFSNGGD